VTSSGEEEPYSPIDCTVHDRLLDAATLGRAVELEIDEQGVTSILRGAIMDVSTRGDEEYLTMADGRTVRLDRIKAFDGRPLRG
jgi:transcriptional antiterminator Rof (Rho-off)